MKILFFALTFLAVELLGAAPAAPVFTGTLTHDRLGRTQLARVTLLSYFRPAAGDAAGVVTSHAAILSLHLGDFAAPEHVSLFYDNVRLNPQTREYLFLPPTASEGPGKLPTVRLKFSDADHLEGDYLSPTAGNIGKLKLKRGLEVPAATVGDAKRLTPLAGYYEASCPYGQDGSRFLSLQIAPSRLPPSTAVGPEAALSGVNYLAAASCHFAASGGALGCGALEPGYYDFYRGEVKFLDSAKTAWTCRRDGDESLSCSGPWISNCTLTRKAGAERKPETPISTTAPTVASGSVSPAPVSGACGSWDGSYRGILRHKATGREQYVDFRLSTILIEGPQPPVRCALLGNAELVFGSSPEGRERLNYNIPHFEFVPNRPEQVLFSDAESDLILQVSQTSAGRIEGNWYSKLYGFVGEFAAVTGFEGRAENIVPGIAGTYTLEGDREWMLDLSAIPGVPDPRNKNPYHQLHVSGWEFFGGTRIPIETVAYDYVANWVSYPTRGRYNVGPATSDGLKLQSLLRLYLGVPGGQYHFKRP